LFRDSDFEFTMLIIGVVGQIASGKGILVSYLTEKLGFTSFSLSSAVHREIEKKGIKKYTRQMLQDVGDEMRRREGDEVLARRVIEAIQKQTIEDRKLKIGLEGRKSKVKKNLFSIFNYQPPSSIFYHRQSIIIDGIRNPAEIEFLRNNSNFILIGVKANRELRFKRLLFRGKEWDPKTYEDFLKVDRRDIGVGQNKSGQQVGKCLAYCDYMLTNNKDVKDFQGKVEKLMKKIVYN